MMTATYSIPECNLEGLAAEVERLNRRCDRLEMPRIEMVSAFAHFDEESKMPYHTVTITGATPTLNGWAFIATLEPLALEDGTTENIVAAVPGHECPPEFRTIIGRCDHCQANRRRSQTFVVRSESEGYKCVGRQCIKDFLGYHGDPQAIAKMCEMLAAFASYCRTAEQSIHGRVEDYIPLATALQITSQVVRLCGWLSRAKARELAQAGEAVVATANKVQWLLTPPSPFMSDDERELRRMVKADTEPQETDKTMAEAAIEWAKGLDESQRKGDYLNNVSVLARAGYCKAKTLGIACSILVAHGHHLKNIAEQARRNELHPSEWFGTVGVREKGPVKVTCNRLFRSEGMYGVTGIHNMTDAAGNELVWFATSAEWMTEGQEAHVSFTVTNHGEYKGRKQTTVSRLKIWTADEVAAHEAKEAKKAARAAKKKN